MKWMDATPFGQQHVLAKLNQRRPQQANWMSVPALSLERNRPDASDVSRLGRYSRCLKWFDYVEV